MMAATFDDAWAIRDPLDELDALLADMESEPDRFTEAQISEAKAEFDALLRTYTEIWDFIDTSGETLMPLSDVMMSDYAKAACRGAYTIE